MTETTRLKGHQANTHFGFTWTVEGTYSFSR